ncbi:DUF2235 domain-containing protein [Jeongeupia sp. USM3]|uniref:T6SS phospholipase effector Tle1-like catalytic domain-containing protein n=1 Tax=Jeongeupia sp. USM3 TaxID=1906741 RepID=UPI0009F6A950|nr:DUF2235 domain-containing protein [Jeongeupia sp. USM3]
MSMISGAPAHIAPLFPEHGYLPRDLGGVLNQRRLQLVEVGEDCIAKRSRGEPAPCAQVLNISLFFDGTNNHEQSDKAQNPVCTSNIARLFHATIRDEKAQASGYYSYYINGVGTSFPEIGEDGPSDDGLKYASGGEKRILWGLTRIVDAMRLALSDQQDAMSVGNARQLISAMEYVRYKDDKNRERVAKALKQDRKKAMDEAMQSVVGRLPSYKPTILKLKLFVYGFSRGAAEARAFVGRLQELCSKPGEFYGVPISIEFLGLLDTVASVGFAPVLGGAEGHMGWADGSMALPNDTTLLKRCAHLVSAHEQRLCFALDSIRRKDGSYPPSSLGEWVYPGVHSDVGGGYPPGDQGKALGGQGMLLSQLPLHHLYALAFEAGAPLCYNKKLFAETSEEKLAGIEEWRWMTDEAIKEFDIDANLRCKFNEWKKNAARSAPIENIFLQQTAQITAWRINRFAGGLDGRGEPGQNGTNYYRNASDDPEWLTKQKKKCWERQRRKKSGVSAEELVNPDNKGEKSAPYTPNTDKMFEPTLDKTQLTEAATDFTDDYLDRGNSDNANFTGNLASFFLAFSRPFSEDCGSEREQIRGAARNCYEQVMADSALVSLYDDHVHDSRAWFMHSALKKREPGGSYFRYRTIFFSDGNSNKEEICKAPVKTSTHQGRDALFPEENVPASQH